MNYKGKVVVFDADSLCYAAGFSAMPAEAEMKFDKYIDTAKNNLQPSRIMGFFEAIEGKNIFRNQVAVTRPYKSNRVGREKPAFTNMMKDYAQNKYGFHQCLKVEAEDAVQITSFELGLPNCVKACCDKDMLTSAGLFYNYFGTEWRLPYYTRIDEHVIHVSHAQAEQNLYMQILTGDGDDAIDGIKGCGKVKAQKVIDAEDDLALPLRVAKTYKEAHENFSKVVKPLTYEYLLEQSRLIYILRSHTDVFTPVTRTEWDAL